MDGYFEFGNQLYISVSDGFPRGLACELWHNFCFTASTADISVSGGGFFFRSGKAKIPENFDTAYTLSVTDEGFAATAKDARSLMLAYYKLLSLIEAEELDIGAERLKIPAGIYTGTDDGKLISAHLCLFPETKLDMLRKSLRLLAYLGFSHTVLEFWGTFSPKCLPELGWAEKCYTTDELKPIIAEANALGIKIIPMLNHFGHASQSRCIYGKHSVLDQNPRLATLFSDNGWAWNMYNPKVPVLLKKLREELYELCGECEYFHIGCDECDVYNTPEHMAYAADFLADICREVVKEGRRPIIWGDQFLPKECVAGGEKYIAYAHSKQVAEAALAKLPRETVIADWQYYIKGEVWKSAEYFMKMGFDVICAPWKNPASAVKTVKETEALGIMETTWDQMRRTIYFFIYIRDAFSGFERDEDHPDHDLTMTATLLRKLSPAKSYAEAGWEEDQMQALNT